IGDDELPPPAEPAPVEPEPAPDFWGVAVLSFALVAFALGGAAPGAQMPVGAVRSVRPRSPLAAVDPSGPNPLAVLVCALSVSQVKPRSARRNGPRASLVLNRLSVRWDT